MDFDGTQVGEDAEPLAKGEQTLLGSDFARGVVVLRRAHRAEEHGVTRLAGGERRVSQRGAVIVDRLAADRLHVELERVAMRFRDGLEHPLPFSDDLRADAIAWKKNDFCAHVCVLRMETSG